MAGSHRAVRVQADAACSVGECALLGVGTIVSSRIQIGRHVIARPGSVVVNDIPDDVLIGGNPAQIVGKRRQPQ
jgi:maltose O-acetyltransferase